MAVQGRRFPCQVGFAISARASELLLRLRVGRKEGASAWLRRVLDQALADEFSPEALEPDSPLPAVEEPVAEPVEELVVVLDDPHVPMLPAHELDARRAQPALVGWWPNPLLGGRWGARHDVAELLPADLVGRRIVVTDKRGRSWTSEVLEVVERTLDTVLVRDKSRYVRRRRPDAAGPG